MGHSDKVLDLVRHVRDVKYEQTGSELEASLREAALIRSLKPPYNRLSKHLPRVAFLKLTVRNAYPRLSVTAKPGSGSRMYVGPFRNRDFAERASGSWLGFLVSERVRATSHQLPRRRPA